VGKQYWQALHATWIKWLVWATIIVWSFGQLLILPSPNSQIRWYALDFFALLLGLSILLKPRLIAFVSAQPLSKPIAVFILVLGVSLILAIPRLNSSAVIISSAYWIRLLFLSLLYFSLRHLNKKQKKPLLLFSIALFITLGIGQYILWPDTRNLSFFGYDDHYYRLIGSFLDPNFTGLILAVSVLIAWHHFKGLMRFTALIPLAALALTFSRSSYLAFGVGLVYLALKKRWWPILGLVPILVSFILAAPKPFGEGVNLTRTYSIESRVSSQGQGLSLWLQRPFFGHGFNTLATYQSDYSENFTPIRVGGVDNSFFYILATGGVIGFAAFVYLLYSLWKLASWTPVVQAALLSIFAHSWWNNSFFYSWIFVFIIIMADYASLRKTESE
jgi:O-antigen ligase